MGFWLWENVDRFFFNLFWSYFLFLFLFTYFFNIYFLRVRERQSTSRAGAERGRHRIGSRLQALSCQHRARHGARIHKVWDPDPSQSWSLNRLSHPGAPLLELLFKIFWGTWVTQLVKHLTLDFGSGHELAVCEFTPCIRLHADSAEPAWDPLSFPLSLPLPCSLSLFLSHTHTLSLSFSK